MSQSREATPCLNRSIPPLRLTIHDWGWVASAENPETGKVAEFPPFQLPLPPRQRIDWLVIAGHRFWQRHRRGMVTLLLIDCHIRQWLLGWPKQHCGQQSAQWSLTDTAPIDPASPLRIGGTFHVIAPGANPTDHLPDHHGLHFVLRPFTTRPLSGFVRDDQGSACTDPVNLCSDDFAPFIEDAMPRLRLD